MINDELMINSIKMLGLDMIDTAKSGHPGIVLGATPIIYKLYKEHLRYNVTNPKWINRDRFVLSSGHGSAMLYATLYMMGYDYSLDDLKHFRTIESCTPGHPEVNILKGIETTTGPLGQGIANAVGMAIGQKYLQNIYGQDAIDYNVYTLCGDGDLMEGISYEACSLAGTLKLDNLILLYDSNDISLDGKTSFSFNDDIAKRFEAMNFKYYEVTKIDKLDDVLNEARTINKPVIIEVKTIIGEGSVNENTNKVHGAPLVDDDLKAIRLKLGMSQEKFNPGDATKLREYVIERNQDYYKLWQEITKDINFSKQPWNIDVDEVTKLIDSKQNMRDINKTIINYLATKSKFFIGGSADVSSSTKTYLDNLNNYSADDYQGRNIYFGVREHAMGAIMNGLALSCLNPFGSCFLTFSDYLKPALRLSAIMQLPVTYIFTHDSILVGPDGKTHQPIEQLGTLRAIPNMNVYRPASSEELIGVYECVIKMNAPSVVVLPRDRINTSLKFDHKLVSHGGYIVQEFKDEGDFIIIASGKELEIAQVIANALLEYDIRVVSMPNLNAFLNENITYQDVILPSEYKKIIIEFSNDSLWYKLMNKEDFLINVTDFGYSGSKEDITKKMHLDIQSIINKITNTI